MVEAVEEGDTACTQLRFVGAVRASLERAGGDEQIESGEGRPQFRGRIRRVTTPNLL
jgi:hypothetical protein